MSYHEHINTHIAALPENLQKIHTQLWDESGRPTYENSYIIALGKLCVMSNDWDEFSKNCKKFFYESVDELHMDLAWHVYAKGVITGSNISYASAI